MKEDILKHILKQARRIEPTAEFMTRSLREITTTEQVAQSIKKVVRYGVLENIKFSFSLVLASLILFVIFGGYGALQSIFPTLNNLAQQDIVAESHAVDSYIRLDEVRYFDESAQDIAAILEEIDKTNSEQTLF